MRTTYTYVCSAGHLVKAETSAVNIDSLCGRCKALARRQALRLRGPQKTVRVSIDRRLLATGEKP